MLMAEEKERKGFALSRLFLSQAKVITLSEPVMAMVVVLAVT